MPYGGEHRVCGNGGGLMGWPQVLVIILLTAKVVIHCCWHGRHRPEPFHWPSAMAYSLMFAALLYWGGFFG